jgi:hypothetical protein
LSKRQSNGDNPPPNLGKSGTILWQSIASEFRIDNAGLYETLLQICECKYTLDDIIGRKSRADDDKTFQALLKAEVGCRSFIVRGMQRLGVGKVRGPGRPGSGGVGITYRDLDRLGLPR